MSQYSAQDIDVLEGLEPVRKRPHMYIGSVDSAGLHHCLWEIVDNAIDEAMNGFAKSIKVTLHASGREVTVEDNGRGIPVDIHPQYGVSALELIMTRLHAGGKFRGQNYSYSGGLHGVGSSVVNALSSLLTVEVRRGGLKYRQEYRQGKPEGPVEEIGSSRGSGTKVTFVPDESIFTTLDFQSAQILEVLESRSYLHNVPITFHHEGQAEPVEIIPEGGLSALLKKRLQKENVTLLTEDYFSFFFEADPRIELVLHWCDVPGEKLTSFVNGIHTAQGGTHESGVRSGILRAVRNYIEHQGVPKGVSIQPDDLRDGIRGLVSFFHPDPQFKGQTKERLNNPGVSAQIAGVVAPALERYLLAYPSVGEVVVNRAVAVAKARQAAEAAATLSTKKSASRRAALPGKLADCSSRSSRDTELFIVEGDSAGGSAKQGRDRKTQAILPLRGKVLNTEQASLKKLSANREIQDLVTAIGCGIGAKFNLEHLRYGKIVILTDADADGHHIAGLLLTFFFRFMPELIEKGHVYLGRPPLYRVVQGKKETWMWSDEELEEYLSQTKGERKKLEVTRFKGLGEMNPKQLKTTTLDPKTRTLYRIRVEDATKADLTFQELFGRDASPRFKLVMERAAEADEIDV